MKFFKRMLWKWCYEGQMAQEGVESSSQKLTVSRDVESSVTDSDPVLNFRVFSAVGGRVVEFRQYDRQKDRNHTTTYIITNEQDFGERIAKIATMESLKT